MRSQASPPPTDGGIFPVMNPVGLSVRFDKTMNESDVLTVQATRPHCHCRRWFLSYKRRCRLTRRNIFRNHSLWRRREGAWFFAMHSEQCREWVLRSLTLAPETGLPPVSTTVPTIPTVSVPLPPCWEDCVNSRLHPIKE